MKRQSGPISHSLAVGANRPILRIRERLSAGSEHGSFGRDRAISVASPESIRANSLPLPAQIQADHSRSTPPRVGCPEATQFSRTAATRPAYHTVADF